MGELGLRPFAVILLAVLAISLAIVVTNSAHGATIRAVDRPFYLSTPPALSSSPPRSEVNNTLSLTNVPLQFHTQSLLFTSLTLSGSFRFSLWLRSNITTRISLRISIPISGANSSSPPFSLELSKTVSAYNFTYTPAFDLPLNFGSPITLYLQPTVPSSANATLYFGSNSTPSYFTVPMSGYETVTTVSILDRNQRQTTQFDLNASIGNNVAVIQATLTSVFGFQDIGFVNLTIVDPTSHPVANAHNQSMFVFPAPSLTQQPPYYYYFPWSYRSDMQEGSYQVFIDVFDRQGNLAYQFGGPVTISLSRTPPLVRAALNILPYVGVTGVIIAGGAFYYTRRKTKSYFAPFDYFTTLTGGELNGGTAVTIGGNTGSGKTLLAEQLMYEDLKKGKPCVFLATGDFPSNVRANMKTMGFDVTGYEQNGLLTFVDGYSSEAGQESREKISVPSLGDLTTLGMKISSSLPDESFKGGSLYFDSLTPLASKAKPENLVSFVQSVGARVKGLGGKAYFTLGPSVDPIVQKQLQEMADCVVQMEAFEEGGVRKSRLRISKLRARRHQQGWVIYTIEDGKGIIFYSKNPKP